AIFLVAGTRAYLRRLPVRLLLATFVSATLTTTVAKLLAIYWQIELALIDTLILSSYVVADTLLLCVLVYMLLDALTALHLRDHKPTLPEPGPTPHVTIHVPIRNEPVSVLDATLRALARLDYPDYDVIVLDNNTTDERLWKPVEALCQELGFTFHHVENLEGYKAGALNLALRLTSPASDLIVIVDADYIVEPDFLRAAAAPFADPAVGFVQTAQGSLNVEQSPVTRDFSVVFEYFYDVTMVARRQRNSIIFAGTMGLISRSALEEVSGWAEWSITEDAELSLRLLARGYRGVYLHHNYGYGRMPANYLDCRRQWYRWIFGGAQYTLRHFWAILLNPRVGLSLRQRIDYLMGGLLMSLSASGMMFMSFGYLIAGLGLAVAAQVSQSPALLFHNYAVIAEVTIIYHLFLVLHSLLIAHVSSQMSRISLRQALAGILSSFSVIIVLAHAVLNALLVQPAAFHRTPKEDTHYRLRQYLSMIRVEVLLVVVVPAVVLTMLLLVPFQPFLLVYVVLGLWQIGVYSTAVWKSIQSTRGETAHARRAASLPPPKAAIPSGTAAATASMSAAAAR
ncbi:MAG: glycosyltransferase family 2 protein, partial [Anaerolineae bacterium]